ncbi:MAG: dihydroorotate dehydrogenase electron transfer subunit [bacterium]
MAKEPEKIYQCRARINEMRALSTGYYLLTVTAPEIASVAYPGQFAQLRVVATNVIDPLLARPISIYHVDAVRGEVAYIFKILGRGTALLAENLPGTEICVLGPIGNGFTVPEAARQIVLVGGGVGMPPLYFLAAELHRSRPEVKVTFFYGGRSSEDILELARWDSIGARVVVATDDGSIGSHGLVTAPLIEELKTQKFDYLAACGPKPMLRAVQKIALEAGIPGQLSLEERMACGVGACLGCVCSTTKGRQRVCVDGPVFALDEVKFDG